MKKLAFATIALVVLFSAHQVSAVSPNANSKALDNPSAEKRNQNSIKEEVSTQENEVEEQESETENEEEQTNGEWKNHGQYVSSVARTNPGGKIVSEAARSDIGKKNSNVVSPTVTPTDDPTVTPTETLTPTPTDDPDATPSPTLTETPTPTPDEEGEEDAVNEQLAGIIEALESLISTLKGLLNLE